MTILLSDYWMGRDKLYPLQLTIEVQANAAKTIARWNALLARAAADNVYLQADSNGSIVTSGWRPREVNDATSNAAANSRHITGEAMDGRDLKMLRPFARWCLRNLTVLQSLGLWMEDPRWTPDWVHLQIVPPLSGHRVFIPSSAPPICAALPEQQTAA